MPPVRHDGAIHLDNRIALSLPTLVPATKPCMEPGGCPAALTDAAAEEPGSPAVNTLLAWAVASRSGRLTSFWKAGLERKCVYV